MSMKLSEQLRKVAFIEIDNPIEHFDKLAKLAEELEFSKNILGILQNELGDAVIASAVEKYLKKKRRL